MRERGREREREIERKEARIFAEKSDLSMTSGVSERKREGCSRVGTLLFDAESF